MKRLLAIATVGFLVLAASGATADTFAIRLVSQDSTTITLGWDPQPGYGYLFTSGGVLRSRTNDPNRSSVRFAKVNPPSYDVDVIVKGANGHYPGSEPPTATFTISPSPAVVGQNVTFDWTGTCPGGGCTTTWEDEGPDGPDGTEFPWGTGDPLIRTFAAVGTKYVHLVVTDSQGLTADSRQQLTVTAVPPTATECSDGVDNDGDTLIDMADPDCSSPADNDETDATPPPPASCDLNATPANFGAQVNVATAGQTVCLASGNYGTFNGTNKPITIAAALGASPQMDVSFGVGDTGFTLDGMTGMGGYINGATNVTIRNSTFTDTIQIVGSNGNSNILLDHNTHNWPAVYNGGANGKILLGDDSGRTLAAPAAIIRNSEIKNGDLDGIHVLGGSGYVIQNNVLDNLCDVGTNHTDNIQFDRTVTRETRVAGNYVHMSPSCDGQGITSFDHGTNGVIIENNVVDIHRPFGIELYSDVNSIVRHNTIVWKPDSGCDFTNLTCGHIDIDRKSADPAGTGTHVYDNIATVDFSAGSTGTADHNVSGQTAVYVGPQTFHDGFLLAGNSPVGKAAASDSKNIGVYAN